MKTALYKNERAKAFCSPLDSAQQACADYLQDQDGCAAKCSFYDANNIKKGDRYLNQTCVSKCLKGTDTCPAFQERVNCVAAVKSKCDSCLKAKLAGTVPVLDSKCFEITKSCSKAKAVEGACGKDATVKDINAHIIDSASLPATIPVDQVILGFNVDGGKGMDSVHAFDIGFASYNNAYAENMMYMQWLATKTASDVNGETPFYEHFEDYLADME